MKPMFAVCPVPGPGLGAGRSGDTGAGPLDYRVRSSSVVYGASSLQPPGRPTRGEEVRVVAFLDRLLASRRRYFTGAWSRPICHALEFDLRPLGLDGGHFPRSAVLLKPSLTKSPLTVTFNVRPRASIAVVFHSPSGFSELSVRLRIRRASPSNPPFLLPLLARAACLHTGRSASTSPISSTTATGRRYGGDVLRGRRPDERAR